jgi:CRISPR-associated protein Cas2
MSADKRWRLVCYDIRTPARWRKVYKIIRGRGTRVQYSVFRCRLDQREVEHLRWELSKVMAPEDALLIVDLPDLCSQRDLKKSRRRLARAGSLVPCGRSRPAQASADVVDDDDENDGQALEPPQGTDP